MSRLDNTEQTIKSITRYAENFRVESHALGDLARTLAAEVDARDEVITKLLDLTAPHVDEFGNRQWWQYKRPEQMHARACEIAGRTE